MNLKVKFLQEFQNYVQDLHYLKIMNILQKLKKSLINKFMTYKIFK